MTQLVAIRPPERGVLKLPKPHLRDLSYDELADLLSRVAPGPSYRTEQVFAWLHQHPVREFAEMTNLPKTMREVLERDASLPLLAVDEVQRGEDGTTKLRLKTVDGFAIETVLIPNDERGLTQCVSSMVGCSLTCAFCATASLGFKRNLSTWEIIDQVYRAQEFLRTNVQGEFAPRITNLVFMGMGEPLHNYNAVQKAIGLLIHPRGSGISGRRITVSTSGFVPGIERFAREGLGHEVGLAISLNATTDEVRSRIMPINTRWNIRELLTAVRKVPSPKRRHLTFEYVLLKDVNDTDEDVERLYLLVRDFPCHVNVIPWNPHSHAPFSRPSSARIDRFVALCRQKGLSVYVRTPRGDDIAAACGQLALEAG